MIDRELLKHVIVPAVIVAFIVAIIGAISFFIHRDMLENQLRDDLNNRILEGRMAIGSINNPPMIGTSEEFTVCLTEEIANCSSFLQNMCPHVPKYSSWDTFGNYEGYARSQCLDLSQSEYFSKIEHRPNLIVLKRENDRYTLYGEQPVAIVITKKGAPFFVKERGGSDSKYYINLKELEDRLTSYLMTNKYSDCKFRNDIRVDKYGYYVSQKYDTLDSLQRKNRAYDSFNYRVNKYFELKLDALFSNFVESYENSYGNDMYRLYYRTYECHFAIKENSNVLLYEYLERFGIIGGIVVFITLTVCYCRYDNLIEKRSKAN